MDEIIERLRALNIELNLPLELPTEEELVLVEEQILISLPYEFRLFLLEVSDVVFGSIEPATAVDPRSHTYLPEMAAVAWDIGMPREYIPVCEYKGGYACIEQDGKIYFWERSGMTTTSWDDIWRWARDEWLEGDV